MSGNGFPALVLNADFRPLSYYPLSLWSWQDTIKAVFLERVNIVEEYDHAVKRREGAPVQATWPAVTKKQKAQKENGAVDGRELDGR